jgi:hypothetical protein
MTTTDLINLGGITFFDYNGFTYAYISRRSKKKNEDLKAFHNIVLIERNEIHIVNNSKMRKEVLEFYDSLGYTRD